MRRLLFLLAALLLAGVAIAYVGPDLLSVGLPTGCDWEVVDIDGQQFQTLDELKQAANQQGAGFAELDAQVAFRDPADGPVEYRPTTCGLQEVETR